MPRFGPNRGPKILTVLANFRVVRSYSHDRGRRGFLLEEESDILRNPADDHETSVFDPAIRGYTDRIVYRFRKPGEGG